MLGLTQGLSNTTTKLFSPLDLLARTANTDFWWTSSYGPTDSSGNLVSHGDTVEHWAQRLHAGNTSNYILVDESAGGKEFLYDRGYIHSSDNENSKWSLKQSDQTTDVSLTATADIYMFYRVKFGTFTGGSDIFSQDQHTSGDHFRILDHNTLRGKIAGGTNRNWDFATNTFVVDTWYNVEIQRSGSTWTITCNGVVSSSSVTDNGTITINRFFAVADGHISDILIKIGTIPSAADREKLLTWAKRKNDLTWESGGLTT